jgi:hypothetical protein
LPLRLEAGLCASFVLKMKLTFIFGNFCYFSQGFDEPGWKRPARDTLCLRSFARPFDRRRHRAEVFALPTHRRNRLALRDRRAHFEASWQRLTLSGVRDSLSQARGELARYRAAP